MSSKRLVISFVAVVILLAIAGVLELVSLAFSSEAAEDAHARVAPGTIIEEIVETAQAEIEEQANAPTEEEIRAADLVGSGDIGVNGAPLESETAGAIVRAAGPYVDSIGQVNQRGVLSSGCEIVALSVAMRAEGFDVDPIDVADHYLHYGGNFATDYIGSPRARGGGFPRCIVDAANGWLGAHGSNARALDLTGTSFAGVMSLVELGYPVVTWTTEGMVNPSSVGSVVNGLQWYKPEHCVVVYGAQGDAVLVSDSLAGAVSRDRATFERIYAACGSLAMMVVPE